MTAFLFIPATVGTDSMRRIDVARMASLFAEVDEPASHCRPPRTLFRVAAAALLVLLAIGDTLLVTRPGSLACETAPRPNQARAMS